MTPTDIIRAENKVIAALRAAQDMSAELEFEASNGLSESTYDYVGTLGINVACAVRELNALARRIDIWKKSVRPEA